LTVGLTFYSDFVLGGKFGRTPRRFKNVVENLKDF
jgi:hypothetical protein